MNTKPDEIEDILSVLRFAPRKIAELSQGLENSTLQARSALEPWSANDILAHLRACADVWGAAILAMLSQEHPTIATISPRTWLRKTRYPQQDFLASLHAYTKQREELLETLTGLKIEDWSRAATFTTSSKTRLQTVFQYARRMALHEHDHCAQIEALLKQN